MTGKLYPEVSRAYYESVHEVLMGKKTAPEAAAAAQEKLMQIIGLKSPVVSGSAR